MDEPSDFVTVTEALAQTGLSADSLYRRRVAKEVEVYAAPHDRRIRLLRREDLERLAEPRPIVGRTVARRSAAALEK